MPNETPPDTDPRETKGSHWYRPRAEAFDVVLIKDGVSAFSAKPEDFRRVAVTAVDPAAARVHANVVAVTGFGVHQVVGPDVQTQDEHAARQREYNERMGASQDLRRR